MPRIKVKKRPRVFHGKKFWEVSDIDQEHASSSRDTQGQLGNDRPIDTTPTTRRMSASKQTTLKNMSAEKLQNSDFKKLFQSRMLTRGLSRRIALKSKLLEEVANGFIIQYFSILNECLGSVAVCRSCMSPKSKLRIFQRNKQRQGLAESLFVKCLNCGSRTEFWSSKTLPGKHGPFEVNRRSVMASVGQKSLSKFCAKMNLPPPIMNKSYNAHIKAIKEVVVEQAEQKMNEAASRLKKIIESEEPESIEVDEDGNTIARCAVTVDGTWQKRGHSSRIGVVFILSVRTGEVLDFKVLSHICHACIAHRDLNKDSNAYKTWFEEHKNECLINHKGSSGNMETSGAVDLFSESISKRGLKYTKFVGDGDSSCYGSVAEAMEQKFGLAYPVAKEECVGHVQKRMGAALTKFKKDMKGKRLSDGKVAGGAGRLTAEMIKKIQNYYGIAIRQNCGNLDGMRRAIKAILHHIVQDPSKSLEVQHHYCPKNSESWCRFWRDKAKSEETYSENGRLSHAFSQHLTPIFERLSHTELLSRCLMGLTQNQNESINGILWSRIPKTVYCGARKVTIGVCETICVANTGAASKAIMVQEMGMSPGKNMYRALREEDKVRIRAASRRTSKKYRLQRRRLKFGRNQEKSMKIVSYKAGCFGTSIEPETVGSKAEDNLNRSSKVVQDKAICSKKRKRKNSEQYNYADSSAPKITFVDEDTLEILKVEVK